MNPIDVAKGYKKLLEMKGHPITRLAANNKDYDMGVSKLGRELGVSQPKISQYLNLLWEPEYVFSRLDMRRQLI